jgi:hypothetical protein
MLAAKGFDLRSDAALRARINGVSGARAPPVDWRARPDPPARHAAPPHAAPHRPRAAQIEKDGFMDEQEAEEEEEEEVKATPKKGACERTRLDFRARATGRAAKRRAPARP